MTFGILQRYILKELLEAFFMTLIILTSVFFLVVTMQIVHKYSTYLSFLDLLSVSPYLIGNALSFTIPMALLSSTTITYGRMSQDREILILRAAGIHARKIFRPAFILGFVLCFVCFYLNSELLPLTLLKRKSLKYKAIEVLLRASFSSKETTIDFIPDIRIHYKRLYRGEFQRLVIQHLKFELLGAKEAGFAVRDEILASSGKLVYDKQRKLLTFYLKKGSICHIGIAKNSGIKKEERFFFDQLALPLPLKNRQKMKLNRTKYKRFRQLTEDMDAWNKQLCNVEKKIKEIRQIHPLDSPQKKRLSLLLTTRKKAHRKYIEHLFAWHTCLAMSLAPLLIVCLGASLGLLIRHSNRLVAFGASAIPLLLVYYPLQICGRSMVENYVISPFWGGWLGNFATGGMGIVLLWYVYRK